MESDREGDCRSFRCWFSDFRSCSHGFYLQHCATNDRVSQRRQIPPWCVRHVQDQSFCAGVQMPKAIPHWCSRIGGLAAPPPGTTKPQPKSRCTLRRRDCRLACARPLIGIACQPLKNRGWLGINWISHHRTCGGKVLRVEEFKHNTRHKPAMQRFEFSTLFLL